MSRTAARMAELEAISRERALSAEEQLAVVICARRLRAIANARHRYADDPDYRLRRYGVARTRRDVAVSKARDPLGRFA